MGHAATAEDRGWSGLDALVTQMVQARRQVAAAQARESRLLADAVDLMLARQEDLRATGGRRSAADLPLRELAAELGAAMRLSDRSVQRRLGDAATLVTGFPETFAAWQSGEIDAGHVTAIVDAGLPLSSARRARFEELALAAARAEAAGRMPDIARVIAARVDPDGAAERIRERQSERRVRVIDLDDGMARLLADLPATLAHAIHDRLTRMAITVRDGDNHGDAHAAAPDGTDVSDAPTVVTGGRPAGENDPAGDTGGDPAGDTRGIDQVRADILTDLLLGGAPVAHGDGLAAITGHVQVTIPACTLAGAGTEPALLAGHGPIDTDTARSLAGTMPGWDRLFTDPHTGLVLTVDRYRPSEAITRYLRARDERCRFPGCRRQARGCDLDHTIDAALGGATCTHNLCHLCRRHHTLKHNTAWQIRQLQGGIIEWRSPLGRTYRDHPPATVTFVPTTVDPPPF
ncbi:MAG: DUF222 domain-containing protein [Microbacterium sp.]|uniref:HNH endonuclease signature motif containing protein n=1 Tax=Microbacterium sp. TaxID=51671 RepID=UPI0026364A65|nr:HNH endonuclease signature motif containing protein [Microbacterium sp.]MCX6503156.1 DUF222 domain-containing protein [Microbacterium sp.]